MSLPLARRVASPAPWAVAIALLAVLLLPGCSREFGPGETGPQVASSPESARTKLRLQLTDPCYTADARTTWTRCARWVEETAGSARTAVGALPDDPVLARASDGIAAGRNAFLGRGCGPTPSPSADVGACVAALTSTRDQVRVLATALAVPGA